MTTTELLFDAADLLNDEIKKAFQEQGHHLTGMWEESLSATSYAPNEVEGWAMSYGAVVDAGVTPDRIPFGGESFHGTGGVGISGSGESETFHPTSKYIQGLFNFWKLRKPGISDKDALSLAFATAKVQKKEGMSTNASRAYSETGERQKFIEQAFIQGERIVTEFVLDGMTDMVNKEVAEPRELVF